MYDPDPRAWERLQDFAKTLWTTGRLAHHAWMDARMSRQRPLFLPLRIVAFGSEYLRLQSQLGCRIMILACRLEDGVGTIASSAAVRPSLCEVSQLLLTHSLPSPLPALCRSRSRLGSRGPKCSRRFITGLSAQRSSAYGRRLSWSVPPRPSLDVLPPLGLLGVFWRPGRLRERSGAAHGSGKG